MSWSWSRHGTMHRRFDPVRFFRNIIDLEVTATLKMLPGLNLLPAARKNVGFAHRYRASPETIHRIITTHVTE